MRRIFWSLASHDYITLSGTASNANNLSRAMSIAEAYAPKKVINSMQVGGVQQVMLEVRVAEMNRELIRRLGINATAMTPQGFGMTALNQLTSMLGGNSFAGVTGGLLTNTLNLSQQATSRSQRRVSISDRQRHLVGFRRCLATGEHYQGAGKTDVDGLERSGSGFSRGW